MKRLLLLVSLAVLSMSGCEFIDNYQRMHQALMNSLGGNSNLPLVDPGRLFPSELLNVHAPNSTGWRLLQASQANLVFAAPGKAPDESYVARVGLYGSPDNEKITDFLSYMREAILKNTPRERYNVLRSDSEYSTSRKYTCVATDSLSEDTQAQTGHGKTEKLLFQEMALSCRHPVRKDLIFTISYSHRGKMRDENIDSQAKDFFAGVQVPDPPPGEKP